MTTIPLAAVKVGRVCYTATDAGLIVVTKADEEIECLLGLLLEVTVWLEVYFADFKASSFLLGYFLSLSFLLLYALLSGFGC